MPKKEVARARAKKQSMTASKASKKSRISSVSVVAPAVVSNLVPPAEEMEDAEYDESVFDGLSALKDDD